MAQKPRESPLVAAAKAAIDAVFSDRSVGPALTRDRLETLRDEIDSALEALASDARLRLPAVPGEEED
jgi:hypothetical protein